MCTPQHGPLLGFRVPVRDALELDMQGDSRRPALSLCPQLSVRGLESHPGQGAFLPRHPPCPGPSASRAGKLRRWAVQNTEQGPEMDLKWTLAGHSMCSGCRPLGTVTPSRAFEVL